MVMRVMMWLRMKFMMGSMGTVKGNRSRMMVWLLVRIMMRRWSSVTMM